MTSPRSVLVTSCAEGLGQRIAVTAASRGWQVFVTLSDASRSGGLRQALRDVGADATVLEMDPHEDSSVNRAVQMALRATEDRLHAVVNVPGDTPLGFFEDLTDAQLRHTLDGVLFGAMSVTRAVLPTMRRRRSGHVVNISSHAALAPSPTLSALAAATWALEGWSESLALEVAPFDVDVSVLQPSLEASLITPSRLRPGSAYRTLADRAEPRVRGAARYEVSPEEEVAEAVLDVLGEHSPRLRVPVGKQARSATWRRRLMPFREVVRSAAEATGLSKPAPESGADRKWRRSLSR